jgi:hypothetical protein
LQSSARLLAQYRKRESTAVSELDEFVEDAGQQLVGSLAAAGERGGSKRANRVCGSSPDQQLVKSFGSTRRYLAASASRIATPANRVASASWTPNVSAALSRW